MSSARAFSTPIFNSTPGQYADAPAVALFALLLAGAMTPLAGGNVVYPVLSAAVAFSAFSCGLGPSVLAVAVALFGVRYWFINPSHSFSIPDQPQSLGVLAFLLVSSVIVAIGERSRRDLAALRESQEVLEERLRERTAELDIANQGLGDLTARLLQLQDEERRRIARELHDSAGQSLAALAMNLSSLGADIERLAKSATVVSDSIALVNDMTRDIRTISYLLHPPLLDEAGLASALRWYIKGFTERSGIKVHLELADDFERLPQDLETAIFRLVRSALRTSIVIRRARSPRSALLARTAKFELKSRIRARAYHLTKNLSSCRQARPGWESEDCGKDFANLAARWKSVPMVTAEAPWSQRVCRLRTPARMSQSRQVDVPPTDSSLTLALSSIRGSAKWNHCSHHRSLSIGKDLQFSPERFDALPHAA